MRGMAPYFASKRTSEGPATPETPSPLLIWLVEDEILISINVWRFTLL